MINQITETTQVYITQFLFAEKDKEEELFTRSAGQTCFVHGLVVNLTVLG